jgi:hypothetical protein
VTPLLAHEASYFAESARIFSLVATSIESLSQHGRSAAVRVFALSSPAVFHLTARHEPGSSSAERRSVNRSELLGRAACVKPHRATSAQSVGTRAIAYGGNHPTRRRTNEFYKSDGTLYRSGCSTATAERFSNQAIRCSRRGRMERVRTGERRSPALAVHRRFRNQLNPKVSPAVSRLTRGVSPSRCTKNVR